MHVFICRRIFHHRAYVNAALVRKGTRPDVSLLTPQGQIRQFGHIARHASELLQILRANRSVTELQFQIGQNRAEIGVAAAFAIAVHTTLYMRDARFDRDQSVGYGHLRVIVSMNA